LFGSIVIKNKVTKSKKIQKKSKPVQTNQFQFGFLGQKPVPTDFA
jgi:hypothetical protein